MNATTERQMTKTKATKHDPLAKLRAEGLVRESTSATRDVSMPTIKPKGGSVTDLLIEMRG
jgi:hypothetical protein